LNQAEMHKVNVPYEFEGVQVHGPAGSIDQYNWADVIITHLDYTQTTITLGQIIKKPVINIIHNSHPYPSVINARENNFCIYNSQWLKNKLNYKWPSMVFNPPCDYRHYDIGKDPINNEFITLINLDENKGGKILQRLAKALPGKKFLAITGSYSEPAMIGQVTNQPSNVTVWPKQVDIRPVYERTRILIMPSRYESWGMTATEAMCNGIPVICTPTEGLRENCAGAGIYINERGPIKVDYIKGTVEDDGQSYDISYMVKQIEKLDSDKKYYKIISDECRKRSRELDPQRGLEDVEAFIIRAANSIPKQPAPQYHRMNMI